MLNLLIKLIGLLIILIAPNPIGQLAYLEEVQLIKYFVNHQTSIKRSNYLLKLCLNGIKLLLLQKYLTNFSQIELAQRNNGRNNFNTQHHQYSVSSTNFITCIYPVYQKRTTENYKTLYRLVSLGKLLERAIKRLAEGTISKPLLPKVTDGILSLLQIMEKLFQYRRLHQVKLHLIYYLFSLWTDQFPLVPVQTLGSGKTFTMDQFQDFFLKESQWLLSFC